MNLNKIGYFNLILILWTGIVEFSPAEQQRIFVKLARFLKNRGQIIIDTIPENITPLFVKRHGKQFCSITSSESTVYGFFLNVYDIIRYARKAGFANVKYIDYKTDTLRSRRVYILN